MSGRMSSFRIDRALANTFGKQHPPYVDRSQGQNTIDLQYQTKFNQVSMDSTLVNQRRTPPLPRAGNSTITLLGQRLEHRPSYNHQNSMEKNASRGSLHSEHSRRYTTVELLHRNSSRQRPELPNMRLEPRNQTVLKQPISSDAEMAIELLKITREENLNLKNQNNFLLQTVRELNNKEKSMKQTIMQYEIVIGELTDQNQILKKRIQDMTEDAKKKISEFQQNLAALINERKSIESQQMPILKPQMDYLSVKPASERVHVVSPSQFYFRTMSNLDGETFNQYLSHEDFNPTKEPSDNDNIKQDNDSLQLELNNQFEALIYSCRVEKNPEKRKQIRKRLVELTYKMRALGKK